MKLDDKVIIIGGGIGGLALGIALRRAGFDCEIFEREVELRPAGAGLLLQAAPMQALASLSLDREILKAGQELNAGVITSADGNILQRTELDFVKKEFGQPTVGIHRARLQSVLLGALGPAPVRTGKKLIEYVADAEGVTARFDDGSVARGGILVGADGLRSTVRKQLLGDTPLRYAGYSTYRGIAEDSCGAQPDRLSEAWGRGRRFGIAPIAAGETYWFAVFNSPAGETSPAPKRFLTEMFREFAAPVPQLIEATPENRMIRTDIYDRVPVNRWSAGRVSLLGDAAHPTTPNLGQGAGMAIEDAVVLAHHLRSAADVEAAFRGYESARVVRAKRIVEASWQLGSLGQMDGAISTAFRDFLVRVLPASLGRRQLRENARFSLG